MKYRIAIASKDGKAVNVHFGLAGRFLLFDIDENQAEYLGERKTTAACLGSCCSGGDERAAFEKVAQDLEDVSAIIVSKIGEGAANFMESHGKAVYEAPFEIEPLINNIISNKLYQTDHWTAVK
ncbi:MAG: hypothetical protein ILP23_03400 [Paludibacteraceae bacterium]|nr:hypothetical protein [Paludibacteraceae bacterium]